MYLYKFVGRKNRFYELFGDNIIKLNFNCPKEYKDGEGQGSCKGYKPGTEKPGKTSNINIKQVKSVITKVKKEQASGKVSRNTINELKSAIETAKQTKTTNIVEQMKSGEMWNAGPVGDIKIESVNGNNITVTANGKTETMSKTTLYKALKKYEIKKIDNNHKIKLTKPTNSSNTYNHNISNITTKLNEISKITDPITRQQFIIDNSKLKALKKYQTTKEKERKTEIKNLKNMIKTIHETEKNPDIAKKKELEITGKIELLKGEYKYVPIKNWEDDSILEFYSSDHYPIINRSLETKNPSKKCSEFTSRLSSIIKSNKIESDISTFRGISDSAYEKLVSNGMSIGSMVKCPRFTSTSKNVNVAYDFAISNQKNKSNKINIIKIDIPKGTSAMDMTKHLNSNYYEEEILLNSDQQFKVENIEEDDKYRVITWKVI